jgi:hypothetical protein
MSGMIDNNQ